MPKLSDAEVITMEIVGEFMGKDHDKGLWHYFRNHLLDWFPHLGSRANFAKQSVNLWDLKRCMQDHIAWQIGAMDDSIHLVDGFPTPICKYARASDREPEPRSQGWLAIISLCPGYLHKSVWNRFAFTRRAAGRSLT
jgi:hypothetical protein